MPTRSATTRKKLPRPPTDRRAEAFVRDADLTRYDLSELQPTRFEFAPKSARLNMRLPDELLAALKAAAAARGMPYQRFIRQALERALVARK